MADSDADGLSIGVSGVPKLAGDVYVGVGGVPKQLTRLYIGIGGVPVPIHLTLPGAPGSFYAVLNGVNPDTKADLTWVHHTTLDTATGFKISKCIHSRAKGYDH